MAWNYRGYGWTKGTPSPFNLKCDAEQILNFVKNKLRVQGKIGVYGRSLGGIPSTHLASKYPDLIELLIVDRTFARTELIAQHKEEGSLGMKFFHDLFSFHWETTNDLNYLAVPCFKICPADPLDEVVPLLANLPVNAATLAYNTYAT
jgi:pimeloyl-ACP methyl ester carboxylesterase